ncbi:MAG TPA: STAS domain-containing protein [Pseudolabrys sp.]|jgi:stage II sporulation protein AA (anti-sigma F factor antagonist)
MDVIEQLAGSVTILEPRGRIDSVTAKEFGERVINLLNIGRHQLVIDLNSISYISSAGFRQLLIAKKSTLEKRGKLALCGISGEVKRLFDIGAFDELLPVYSTREESIASMQ